MYLDTHETERLWIRKLETSDISGWEAYFTNNPSLPLLGLDDERSAAEKSGFWIGRQLERYAQSGLGHKALILKQTGKLVGQCGLLCQHIDGKDEIEIGYHLLPEYWGQGYASEAAQFFKKYAFENKICDSVVSIIHINNLLSQRVAIKNGMQQTHQTRWNNKPVYVYRINKQEKLL